MNTRSLQLVFLGSLAGFVAGLSPVSARTKTDILHMKNGDKITCEIRFDSTEWINTLWVYPSMTNRGRVRSTFDSSLYLDLVGDLYFRLGVYHNYDSRPPTDTPKIDYGATISIGWSF